MAKKSIEEIIDEIEQINDYIQKLREKKKELETIVIETVGESEDGKPIWIGDRAKVVYKKEAKISQKVARTWAEKNPELAMRVFRATYAVRIAELSKLKRTLITEPDKTPEWVRDLDKLEKDITIETKPILEILKDKEEVEE